MQAVRAPQFYVPAHWTIEPASAGIVATNNYTSDSFEGTQKEFSEMLRNN